MMYSRIELAVMALVAVAMVVVAQQDDGSTWNERSKHLWRDRYPEEFDELPGGDLALEVQTGRKNGLRAPSMRWPNGIVPYEVVGPYTLEQCQIIESAFEPYQQNTCVRFRVKQPRDQDFVTIKNERGCHAELGRVGGAQVLNIGEGACVSKGTVMHELMHVLGFMHEQKRYDRDDYIQVVYDNLRKDKVDNFRKQTRDTITSFGVPYDFESITHYSPLAFSKNGQPTVMLRKTLDVNIGQREFLSDGDIAKVNRMYNCTAARIAAPSFPRMCA